MTKYEVVIAGTIDSTHDNKESAEGRINEIRNSFYALVHPVDCIYIREVEA